MSTQPSLKKNIAISTLYQILLVILPMITAPYIARVLGPDQSGIYDFTNSIQTYFAMFAALGTASYGAREIARVRNDEKMRSVLFWEIELMTVMTSAACIAVWFVFIFFANQYKVIYLVLTMGLFSTMFDISWFFAGMEQFTYTVSKNAVCKLAGVILMFLFVKRPEDLLLYIIIITASTMLGNLSMWLYIPRFVTKVDFKKLRMQIINIMKALTFSSLNMVLGSRIAYLFAEEKYDEIKERIRDSINYILFMGFGICFGLIGVSRRFVPLYLGPGYDRVITMLMLMSPIVIIIGVSNCLGSQYYTPSGNRRLSARFIIIGAIVNFTLNLILIPRFWGYGAIVASLIAETVITVLYFRHCNGYLTAETIFREGWKKLAAGILMLAVIMVMDRRIESNIIALVAEVAVGFTVYCAVIVILRDTFLSEIVMGKILHRKKA